MASLNTSFEEETHDERHYKGMCSTLKNTENWRYIFRLANFFRNNILTSFHKHTNCQDG